MVLGALRMAGSPVDRTERLHGTLEGKSQTVGGPGVKEAL